MPRGQSQQKLRNDLDGLPFSFCNQVWILRELFDALPFEVAARVVEVSAALPIREDRHSAGGQHLHHERGTRARQSRNNGDHELQGRNETGCRTPLCIISHRESWRGSASTTTRQFCSILVDIVVLLRKAFISSELA